MPESMQAMMMEGAGKPLVWRDVPMLTPGPGEVRIAVSACGVCCTDLRIVDGKLTTPRPSLIPDREIVGIVESRGKGVMAPTSGECAGVSWLDRTCGARPYYLHGRKNLRDHPVFTDYTRDGGYAQYAVCDARYCLSTPTRYDDAHTAPLLHTELISYRMLRTAGGAHRIGIYNFGAVAHLITQVAVAEQREVFAFTHTGDTAAQQLALGTGASWIGASDASTPEPPDIVLIFAPIGTFVPQTLRAMVKGSSVVCDGIHMSDIPAFLYRLLWEERELVSVANLTRADGLALMHIAAEVPLRVHVMPYPLQDASTALKDLHAGRMTGAAVLRMPSKNP